MESKRVVVTGIAALTPIGNTIDAFWKNALAGISGIADITRFDASRLKTRFAGELKNFSVSDHLAPTEIRKTDLFTQYALIAATQAVNDSGIDFSAMSPYDCGVIFGTGQGGLITFQNEVTQYVVNGYKPHFSPFFVPKAIFNIASGAIALKYGLKGLNYTTIAACATSNVALADSFNNIRWGKAKVIITGGSEAPLAETCLGGFNSMHAMSLRNDDPATASRPFDKTRDGFVMSEGAGAIILEEYEHAKKRGAKIYAEIVGSGITSDAYHLVAPDPSGISSAQAIRFALEDAGITEDKIDYINAHATSTPVGDVSEMKSIASVFGAANKEVAISATKSVTGHLLGAAGAIEAILSIKAINENAIPPTMHLHELDPDIPSTMKIVKDTALEKKVNYAMSNAFGFGGHNAIVIFKKLM